jgi:lipid-binding SYLF domain-containing protein
MIMEKYKVRPIVAACILAMTSLSGYAAGQSTSSSRSSDTDTQAGASVPASKNEAAAVKHVNDAVAVVRRMESECGMSNLLQQAKGIFIVPTYGRVALGVGGSGGKGVLLAKRGNGEWSDPAFYNVGGLSVGAQAGAEGGPIVLVLNNDKALNRFMEKNNFSLSADAGLTVVNWAKVVQGSVGAGDVVAWAGTKGLFGNVVSVGVNGIRLDQDETNAYYHQTVSPRDIISGAVKNPQADTLKQALAANSRGTASSSSGASTSRGTSGSSSDGMGTDSKASTSRGTSESSSDRMGTSDYKK